MNKAEDIYIEQELMHSLHLAFTALHIMSLKAFLNFMCECCLA